MNPLYFILVLFGLWLFIVSGVLIWVFNYFRRLTKEVKKGNLVRVLDRVLKVEAKNSKGIKRLEGNIKELRFENLKNIQKVGFIRFNPFDEMGGDHSFVLCLLDGKNNGAIFTGLHSRERTRVYMKQIKSTKSTLKLSSEEKKALNKAIKEK